MERGDDREQKRSSLSALLREAANRERRERRDDFAMAAMQGLLSQGGFQGAGTYPILAAHAYAIADAMIEAGQQDA